MKIKLFGLTGLWFHFHRIFKYVGRGGGSSDPPEPPLDPPLLTDLNISHNNDILVLFV